MCIDFFSGEDKAKIVEHVRSAAKQLQSIANEREQARAVGDDEIGDEAGASASTGRAAAKRPNPPLASSRRLRQKTG